MMMRMAMRKNSHLGWRGSGQIKRGIQGESGRGDTGENLHILLITSAVKNDGVPPSHRSTVLHGRGKTNLIK